jgi:hypothetical protein
MTIIYIFFIMCFFHHDYSYMIESVLKICKPAEIRNYLRDEMNKNHVYLTYPRVKKILHENVPLIDIYGDNTQPLNVEHIFPQYLFKNDPQKMMMRSDLHHLYLCTCKLNTYRQNYKYVESSCASKFDNIRILDMKGNVIDNEKDIFTKRGYLMISNKRQNIFIPSVNSRGKIARALSYFAIKYDYMEMLEEIIDLRTMLEWNLKDPVDDDEFLKNIIAYKYQKNLNPFVLHPDLMMYCFADKVPIDETLTGKKRYSSIDPLNAIEHLLKEISILEMKNLQKDRIITKFEKLVKSENIGVKKNRK